MTDAERQTHDNPTIPEHRINDDDLIGFDVSGLIDGDTDVTVYLIPQLAQTVSVMSGPLW